MTVGVGMIGREVTATVGTLTLLGTNNKGINFTNENLETTDDASSGWTEFLAKPGKKTVEFTMSGLLKNLELINGYVGTSQIFAVVVNYPDGSQLTFDAILNNLNTAGESNGLFTFDASFTGSGAITFTPGV